MEKKYWSCTLQINDIIEPWLLDIHPTIYLQHRVTELHRIHKINTFHCQRHILYSEEITKELYDKLIKLEIPSEKVYDDDLITYLYFAEKR